MTDAMVCSFECAECQEQVTVTRDRYPCHQVVYTKCKCGQEFSLIMDFTVTIYPVRSEWDGG